MVTTPRSAIQNRMLEYFVVFSVVALASAVSFIFLKVTFAEARDAQRIGDIAVMRTALELYYLDHGAYPSVKAANSADESWNAFGEALMPYLSGMPRDPINEASAEQIGAFNYSYYSAEKQHPHEYDVRGPSNYVLIFRLEKPARASRHEAVNVGLVTARGAISRLELTSADGVYLVRAP